MLRSASLTPLQVEGSSSRSSSSSASRRRGSPEPSSRRVARPTASTAETSRSRARAARRRRLARRAPRRPGPADRPRRAEPARLQQAPHPGRDLQRPAQGTRPQGHRARDRRRRARVAGPDARADRGRPAPLAGRRGRPDRLLRRHRAQSPGHPRLLAAAPVRLPGRPPAHPRRRHRGLAAGRGSRRRPRSPRPTSPTALREPVTLGERDDSLIATYDEVLAWSRESAQGADAPTRILDVRTAGE